MELSKNRFIDGEDDGIKAYDIEQLKSNCDKWSLASDLGLLSNLKQFSNELLNKTEKANESIDNLVYETKIRCVKVSNVINDFQMLANSQFVENRVYDEEMEDIITSSVTNDITVDNKSKEDEIVPKIKSALNIGLDFLNQKFDNLSKERPHNDSDDEEDQILEGLISQTNRDEFSQRLLPYIIGSEDFIKDTFVGLSFVEESPAIDLKTKAGIGVNDIDITYNNSESVGLNLNPIPESDIFVRNITDRNNYIDEEDSEDESNDLFGSTSRPKVPILISQDNDSIRSSGDENDKIEDNLSEKVNHKIESKPITSFHDELSSLLSGNRISNKPFDDNRSQTSSNSKIVASDVPEMPISTHSDSSDDESGSIFQTSKSKPKIESKSNFTDLFNEESNNTLFDEKNNKQNVNINAPRISPRKLPVMASNLFDDEDDDDEDDLFKVVNKKQSSNPINNKISFKDELNEKLFNRKEENNEIIDNKVSPKVDSIKTLDKFSNLFEDESDDKSFDEKSKKNQKHSSNVNSSKTLGNVSNLFDDEDDDDLFRVINKKQSSNATNHKISFKDELSEKLFNRKVENNEIIDKNVLPEVKSNNTSIKSSKLFEDESNPKTLGENPNKPVMVVKVAPKIVSNKPLDIVSNLFDDEDDDDLFGVINKKQSLKSNDIKSSDKFSNLFDDESDDKPVIQKSSKQIVEKVSPNLNSNKSSDIGSNLFDDEDEDDLFRVINKKQSSNAINNKISFKDELSENLFNRKEEHNEIIDNVLPKVDSNKTLDKFLDLFEDESDDKLFDEKSTKKQNLSPKVNSNKTLDNVLNLFDDEDDEDDDDLFGTVAKKSSQKSSVIKSLSNDESENSLLDETQNQRSIINNDFLDNDSNFKTLSNDSAKQRAVLGSKLNRRPPSKKIVKLTPITDFSRNSEQNSDLSSLEDK